MTSCVCASWQRQTNHEWNSLSVIFIMELYQCYRLVVAALVYCECALSMFFSFFFCARCIRIFMSCGVFFFLHLGLILYEFLICPFECRFELYRQKGTHSAWPILISALLFFRPRSGTATWRSACGRWRLSWRRKTRNCSGWEVKVRKLDTD